MKLLVTGAYPITPQRIEDFIGLGCEVMVHKNEPDSLSEDEFKVDAIVCNGLFLTHDIDDFKNLKYIQLTSAGLDRVPLNRIKERNITLKNARGVYSLPMAEWTIGKVLDIYKKTAFFISNQNNGLWEKERTLREIFAKKIAILGAGSVGSEVARLFKAFGAYVIGFDMFPRVNDYFDKVVSVEDFKSDVSEFDIIVVTAPLTEQTRHYIDGDLVRRMKLNSILINISRGALIDESSFIEAIQHRKDVTAVLDVFEIEPLPQASKLWSCPNVIISPHNSFISEGNSQRLHKVVLNNLQEYLK